MWKTNSDVVFNWYTRVVAPPPPPDHSQQVARCGASYITENQIEAEEKEEEARRSHEFKAMPLHLGDEDWQTIQSRQTVRRNHRIQMRKELVSDSSVDHSGCTIMCNAHEILNALC